MAQLKPEHPNTVERLKAARVRFSLLAIAADKLIGLGYH